ncbi:MAG: beta strand repeat-containing protein [Fluviibacter sp.]
MTGNDGIIGLATENIALNGFGRITAFGVVHGINTTGSSVGETWADNDTLYYNPNYAGGLTNVKPSAPYIKFEIGTVINAGSGGSGSIQVDLIHGSTLGGTDSNVQFGTLANNDLIAYDSGLGYWKNIPSSTFGTGSVTSVSTSGTVNGLTLTGGPITTSGTITLSGTLDLSSPPAIGGTTSAAGTFTTLIGGGGSANYGQLTGGATTKAVEFKTLGSDTNVAYAIRTKGTGAIDLAAGSSGVNISNGGTVTAITRTAQGANYTSVPSVAISAPTTAGGVQATVTCVIGMNGNPTVTAGGTGYTLNDILVVSGGTGSAAQLQVTGVSGGVITSVSVVNSVGAYSVVPANPFSVTGGTGTSATFTLTNWAVGTAFTITNAGSGYVEQPTVTFSGGGGSGAAAYASVGGNGQIKALGQILDLATDNGTGFRVVTSGQTSQYYWQALGHGSAAILRSSGTNVNAQIQTTGTAALQLATNGGVEQFRVSHTASAVNYVQVTGATTGNGPIIVSQGSDATVGLNFSGKGGGAISFYQNGSTATPKMLTLTPTGAAVNYFDITSGITGAAPKLSAQGTDTNIDLAVTPKGTGALVAQASNGGVTINARGANAVDWQTARGAASQVASGSLTAIGGGYGNTANGIQGAISGGTFNTISGTYNFVGGGYGNTSTSFGSAVVGGYSNTAAGVYNLIGGGFTNSGTSASAVTTQSATMNGTTAVTLSGSNASIKVGQYIIGTSIANDTYVAAISGTSLTLSKNANGSSTSTLSFYTPHGVVVGGGNNQATGSYSFIGGGGDAGTAANRNVASGDWSFVGGGVKNTASGLGSSVVGGGILSAGSYYANTASGTSSFIGGGFNNTASGSASFIGSGGSNLANSQGVVLGGARGSTRSIVGYHAFAACVIPIADSYVSQGGLIILGRQTTDATSTVLASDFNSASTTNQVILPNNSAYYFKGTVVAGKTGAGDTKGWTIEGVIKRGANAASTALVGTATVTSTYADAGAATWSITATADTTNGGLAITATGQAATTIRWVCKIETTEMTY